MMDAHTSRLEWVDQLVRATVMLAFTFGAIYGFVVSKVLSTETFVMLALVVLQWWFQKQADTKAEKANGNGNGKHPEPTPAASATAP